MNGTLLSILAGLGGMFGWGTSDFLASQFSEKIGHLKTFFYSQVAALIFVILIVLVRTAHFTSDPLLLVLTVLCGVVNAFAYLFFYRGFAIGNVSVISAVINLQNIFVVGIAYFLFGQRIGGLQIPALFLLLAGVTLVSTNFSEFKKGKISLFIGVKETLIAAVLFGVLFWPMNQFVVQRTDWLTTNMIIKFVALITVFGFSFFSKQQLALEKQSQTLKALFPIAVIGVLEAIAVMSVSSGLSIGNAIIINPIASALTLVTVGLAMVFLKEKITKTQAAGIVATIAGIMMMSLGG